MVDKLGNLEIYQLAIKISDINWKIYKNLSKEFRYTTGKQLLRASDSIGANIAEGFGRFYFNDKIRFYYNARGSLFEVKHWIFLLHKRGLIVKELMDEVLSISEELAKKLNSFIIKSREKR